MASSVNKRSLREEVDVLKADFKQLSSAGKLTPESLTLINALLMVLEVVLAVFMEKMTKKGAGNSSIPTSQTEKDETTLRIGGIAVAFCEMSERSGTELWRFSAQKSPENADLG